MPSSRTRRKPKHSPATVIREPACDPFAVSIIIAGERAFVAQDMRHDEAVKYAEENGWIAVEAVVVTVAAIAKAKSGRAIQLLYQALDKAATKLEGVG